jgi:hypothetical protein
MRREIKAEPHEGLRCGAKTREGKSCQQHPIPGRRRCHYHGGRSTGPSPEGIRRIQRARTVHGRYAKSAIEERRQVRWLLGECRTLLAEIEPSSEVLGNCAKSEEEKKW